MGANAGGDPGLDGVAARAEPEGRSALGEPGSSGTSFGKGWEDWLDRIVNRRQFLLFNVFVY